MFYISQTCFKFSSTVNKNTPRVHSVWFIWNNHLTLKGEGRRQCFGRCLCLFCLLAKYFMIRLTNLSKTCRNYSLDVNLQLIHFGSHLNSKWLPQSTDLLNNEKGYNSIIFTDIDLIFVVVVAETEPQQVLWALTDFRINSVCYQSLLWKTRWILMKPSQNNH